MQFGLCFKRIIPLDWRHNGFFDACFIESKQCYTRRF